MQHALLSTSDGVLADYWIWFQGEALREPLFD
jgi:hypothetical protein